METIKGKINPRYVAIARMAGSMAVETRYPFTYHDNTQLLVRAVFPAHKGIVPHPTLPNVWQADCGTVFHTSNLT